MATEIVKAFACAAIASSVALSASCTNSQRPRKLNINLIGPTDLEERFGTPDSRTVRNSSALVGQIYTPLKDLLPENAEFTEMVFAKEKGHLFVWIYEGKVIDHVYVPFGVHF